MQTTGEHVTSTQKRPGLELNLAVSCCEATDRHETKEALKVDVSVYICNFSPATNGDLTDGIVSVSLVHPSCSGVVLSTQMYPDLGGMHHLLQGRVVVEVVIAWSGVWLCSQQAKCNITA